MQQVGQHWSSAWWGGTLADGTVIVTNPINPSVGIIDFTASPDARAPMYQPKATSLSDWFNHRIDHYGRLPLPLPIAPMRGSILLAGATFVLVVVLYPVFAPPGQVWPVLFGMAGLGLAGLAFFVNEGRFIDPTTTTVVAEGDTSPLAGLRYVPDAVAARAEWRQMAIVAESLGPDNPRSRSIHDLLWSAAGLDVYLDSGNLPESSVSTLVSLRDQALSLA